MINSMIFPVIYTRAQICQGFISQLAIHSLVGLPEYAICGFNSGS
jgi:hypothetical protein